MKTHFFRIMKHQSWNFYMELTLDNIFVGLTVYHDKRAIAQDSVVLRGDNE